MGDIRQGGAYRYMLFFLFWGMVISGKAQYSPIDTLKLYLKKKPTYELELDGRNSFIHDQPVNIDGFRVGLNYGNKIRFYGGAYWSRYPVYRTIIHNQAQPNEVKLRQRLSMFYMAATAEYVLYKTKHWELDVPLQLGIGGGNRSRYLDSNNVEVEKRRPAFVPLEITFAATYNITQWLHVSGGVGYRYALFSKLLADEFSAPIYNFGIGISPVTLLKKLGVVESRNGHLQLKKRKKK